MGLAAAPKNNHVSLTSNDVNAAFLSEEGTFSCSPGDMAKEYRTLRENPDRVPDDNREIHLINWQD